jgi:hypothetical protein
MTFSAYISRYQLMNMTTYASASIVIRYLRLEQGRRSHGRARDVQILGTSPHVNNNVAGSTLFALVIVLTGNRQQRVQPRQRFSGEQGRCPNSSSIAPTTKGSINATMSHAEERFIPERKKIDQLSVIKDYATVPRLEYR